MKSHLIGLRIFTLLLALAFVFPLAACSGRQGKTLLTLDDSEVKVTLSVNHYQFLLSRLRGNFVRQGVSNSAGSADQSAFWDMQGYLDGTDTLKTWDSFYREQVLDTCKTYLVGLWIYEKNNLSLSDSARASIEQELNDYLAYQADGSKAKLNSVLANYGVNYNLLKSFYEMEAKVNAAMQFLYGENASRLDATVKDPYLTNNYFRYKSIFFPFYTVEDGDETHVMTEEEKGAVRIEANDLYTSLQNKTDAEFEAAISERNGTDEYTDGYYIPRNGSVGSDSDQITFFTAISNQLESMDVGEVAILELSEGIQILRRYEPTPGAYDLSVNSVWFSSFANNLMAELFQEECKKYTDKIVLDEKVYQEAPLVKEVEPNYYF